MSVRKSKSKKLRIFFISLVLIILLMIVGVTLFFMPYVKSKIISYVEENTEYKLKISTIVFNGLNGLEIDGVEFRPKLNVKEFYEADNTERDWIAVKAHISIYGIDWEKYIKYKKVFADKISLTETDIYIYRNKKMPDAPYKYKSLPGTILRHTTLSITVPLVELVKGRIEYEEIAEEGSPINVVFSKLYGSLYHLSTDSIYRLEQPEVILDGKGMIMDSIDATMKYKFSSLDKNNTFTFEGNMGHFSATIFNKCIDPVLAGIEIKSGAIEKLSLFFQGNDSIAIGKMDIDYEHLKIDVLSKKHPGKKAVLKTFLSHILISKHDKRNEGELESDGEINATRNTDRFIFNYWWKAVKSGIVSSVVKVHMSADKDKDKGEKKPSLRKLKRKKEKVKEKEEKAKEKMKEIQKEGEKKDSLL